jgi:proteasome alpha subunit
LQRQAAGETEGDRGHETAEVPPADTATLYDHIRATVAEKTLECAVLDRAQPGSSKYRVVTPDQIGRLLPRDINASLS